MNTREKTSENEGSGVHHGGTEARRRLRLQAPRLPAGNKNLSLTSRICLALRDGATGTPPCLRASVVNSFFFSMCVALGAAALLPSFVRADDWPMWGRIPLRQMISPEKNPPTDWDVETGKNIKWSADLGSKSYGNPVVSDGLVYVGTNNEGKRDPNITADGGVLMAFDEATGKFLWQRYSAKLPTGRVNDWPGEGLCSTVYSEGHRIWFCTNRCEVVCLDISSADKHPSEVWTCDMMTTLGVFPHNMTSCSPISWGDYLYVITANGVDDTHKHVVAPNAPSIVCFNKGTGKVVWTNNSPGPNVLHGQWASCAVAEANGRPLVIAPLGDAWVYAFDARTGEIVWKFDTNPKDAVYPQTRNEIIASPCIVGNYMYIANGQDPEHGEGYGHMYCVDITKTGDVSAELDAHPDIPKPKPGDELLDVAANVPSRKGIPNPNSAVVWHYEQYDLNGDGKIDRSEHMNRTISTAVVDKGLCFVPDFSGFLHCFDSKTGKVLWTYDMESAMWGSPLICDGKVYVTDEDGDVRIFDESDKMNMIAEHNMGSASYCSPVFANGVLYISTRDKLYAIQNGANSAAAKPE
jgi:outer membrane protein assembly factor BamB